MTYLFQTEKTMDNQDIENAIVSREDVRGPSIETQAKIETSGEYLPNI